MSDLLAVQLNRLSLQNPILVASGTFGYAKEMQTFVDFTRLGGIVPKTVTPNARPGNAPPRTIETRSGLLNSIGLDNDGIDYFVETHVPYLSSLGTSLIANIAAKTIDQFRDMAGKLEQAGSVAAIELNISCPNVTGGVDFGTNPELTAEVVTAVRESCDLPVIAKLTPNVTSVPAIAQAVAGAGADAVTCVNTFQGIAIDWRKRKPVLGGICGGLSGPAIKPLALRVVYQVAQATDIPIIGVGGIECIDDVMEFIIAGASAVQIGTANFYDPGLAERLVDDLAEIVTEEGAASVSELVKTIA
ncbi:MAG: dihydroorotate dehydrogenase [Planctomycetaceae bacterium]